MEDHQSDRLSEITEYYRANPTPPAVTPAGGQHVHIHHHYAAPPPPPPPPKPSAADKLIPWVYFMVLAMIAATLCAAVLAIIGIILVAVLVAVALVVALMAYLVRSMNEGRALNTLADKSPHGRRTK